MRKFALDGKLGTSDRSKKLNVKVRSVMNERLIQYSISKMKQKHKTTWNHDFLGEAQEK